MRCTSKAFLRIDESLVTNGIFCFFSCGYCSILLIGIHGSCGTPFRYNSFLIVHCHSQSQMKQKQINNIITVCTLAMSEDNSRILEISIPTHKKLNNITHYEVLCITNLQEYKKCYSRVFRRYKQFRHLYKILNGKIVQPEFPKKRFFNYKEEVIKERMAMFSVWLRYIAKLVDDNNCYGDEWAKEVLRFLQDDKYPGYN